MLDGVVVEGELAAAVGAFVGEVGLERRVGEFVACEVVGIHVVLVVKGIDVLHHSRGLGMEATEAKRERCDAEREENHRSGGGEEPCSAVAGGEDYGGR